MDGYLDYDIEDRLYTYGATIISVYDGDTVRADWDKGGGTTQRNEPFRLWGINAPEVRGDTRERGLVVRDYLRKLILGKQVLITTLKDKKGKYGRYIAKVYIKVGRRWLSVNDLLVAEFDDVIEYMR